MSEEVDYSNLTVDELQKLITGLNQKYDMTINISFMDDYVEVSASGIYLDEPRSDIYIESPLLYIALETLVEKLENFKFFHEYEHYVSNANDKDMKFIKKLFYYIHCFYDDVEDHHGFPHVLSVTNNAIEIWNSLDNKCDLREVIVATMLHDCYSDSDRKNHHNLAADYVLREKVRIAIGKIAYEVYNANMLNFENISKAIRHHRASYTGELNTISEKIVSAADRGAPNLKGILKRVFHCAMDNSITFDENPNACKEILIDGNSYDVKEHLLKYNLGDAMTNSLLHLFEKYSRDGYANYNDLYKEYYGKDLENFWNEIQDLVENPDKDKIKQILK